MKLANQEATSNKMDFVYVLLEVCKTVIKYFVGWIIDTAAKLIYDAVMPIYEKIPDDGPSVTGNISPWMSYLCIPKEVFLTIYNSTNPPT